MNTNKFYTDICGLLPYRQDKELNYINRFSNALGKYKRIVSEHKLESDIQESIAYISQKIKRIIHNNLSGLQSTAAIQLRNLIQGKKGLIPKIKLDDMILTSCINSNFYRIRQLDSIYDIEANELFHIPISKRGIVKTERYSIPGYPCLYLGKSIYGCWEEMRRPPMHTCAVSRFKNKEELNFIDLTIPSEEKLQDPKYQTLVPLIIACMIPVANNSDTFKPEYIMPQLIFEWLLKRRKSSNTKIHGIAYTSTHMNDEFSFPKDKFINYAIPVIDINAKEYCKELCSIFQLTKPTTNDIEKLKCGYNIDCGSYNSIADRESNYRTSDFGNLETRLQDTDKFPLQTIDY